MLSRKVLAFVLSNADVLVALESHICIPLDLFVYLLTDVFSSFFSFFLHFFQM